MTCTTFKSLCFTLLAQTTYEQRKQLAQHVKDCPHCDEWRRAILGRYFLTAEQKAEVEAAQVKDRERFLRDGLADKT
jgi:hypothetical protein